MRLDMNTAAIVFVCVVAVAALVALYWWAPGREQERHRRNRIHIHKGGKER